MKKDLSDDELAIVIGILTRQSKAPGHDYWADLASKVRSFKKPS